MGSEGLFTCFLDCIFSYVKSNSKSFIRHFSERVFCCESERRLLVLCEWWMEKLRFKGHGVLTKTNTALTPKAIGVACGDHSTDIEFLNELVDHFYLA